MIYKNPRKIEEPMSVIGIGCWNFGGDWEGSNDASTEQIVLSALDAGINVFDIAPVYGFTHSEIILGKIMKKYDLRDRIFIASKCGLRWDENRKTRNDLSYKNILEEIDESLMRLQTDRVDLYQLHWPDPKTPIEETVEALKEIKKAGKIRYIGLSNFSQADVTKFEELIEINGQQSLYNMLERNTDSYHNINLEYKTEDEVLPHVKKEGQAFFPYSPLFQGLLTSGLRKFGAKDIRNENPKFSQPLFAKYEDIANQLRKLADECGHPLNELAINWLRQKEEVTTIIAGVSSVAQLQQNLSSLTWDITTDLFAEIDKIIEPVRYI